MDLKNRIPKSKENKNKLCIKESKYNELIRLFNDFMWCRVYNEDSTKVIGALYLAKLTDTKTVFMTYTRVHEEDLFDPRIGMKIAINRLAGESAGNIWIARSGVAIVEIDQVFRMFPGCNKERLTKDFNGCVNKIGKHPDFKVTK